MPTPEARRKRVTARTRRTSLAGLLAGAAGAYVTTNYGPEAGTAVTALVAGVLGGLGKWLREKQVPVVGGLF